MDDVLREGMAVLNSKDVPDNLIRRLPLFLGRRTLHLCIFDETNEDEPGFNVMFSKEIEMSKTVGELIKNVGPLNSRFCIQVSRSFFQRGLDPLSRLFAGPTRGRADFGDMRLGFNEENIAPIGAS
jgi:hypothetical protein